MKKSKYPCPCCGQQTLDIPNFYNICPVCDWEDDPGQAEHPDDSIGANNMSLNEAKALWTKKQTKQAG